MSEMFDMAGLELPALLGKKKEEAPQEAAAPEAAPAAPEAQPEQTKE